MCSSAAVGTNSVILLVSEGNRIIRTTITIIARLHVCYRARRALLGSEEKTKVSYKSGRSLKDCMYSYEPNYYTWMAEV